LARTKIGGFGPTNYLATTLTAARRLLTTLLKRKIMKIKVPAYFQTETGSTIGAIVIIVLLILAVIGVSGLIAMLLWNWVIVGLFGTKTINYWLGLGLGLITIFPFILYEVVKTANYYLNK
jgi:hypothetical protein